MHRLVPLLLLALCRPALAKLPMTNRASTWAEDQAVAAEWFGLTPFVWGWIVAGAFVLGALALLLARPRPSGLPRVRDIEPARHDKAVRIALAAVLLVYLPGVFGDFNLFDDYRLIHWDDTITELTWPHLREVVLGNPGGNNQELMYLSFQLNWAVAPNWYPGWYLPNLAVLAGILLLAHRMALRLLDHRLAAVLVIPFLGLSPVLVEIVAWMSARCHLYGLLFALGSCVAYLESRRAEGELRWKWLAVSVLAFGLTQFSKPIFLFLPAWLVLFDLWERRRDVATAVAEKVPFALVAALFFRKLSRAAEDVGRARDEYLGGSALNTLYQDFNHLVEYGRAALLPFETGLRVPWNAASDALHVVGVPHVLVLGFAPLASLVVLVAVLAVALLLGLRHQWWLPLIALAAFGASLVTVMNFPAHGTVFAYRYTLSAQVIAAVLLADGAVRLAAARPFLTPRWRWVPVALTATWLVLGARATNANRAAWRDSASYWTRNVALYPKDGWSHYYAGKALQREKEHEEALPHLRLSLQYLPDNHHAHKRLADVAFELGEHDEARTHYRVFFVDYRQKPSEKDEERLNALGMIRAR